jgi:DNA primase
MSDQKPDGWVDFRAVKEAVTMRLLFEHYGLDLDKYKAIGDERKLSCPLCDGKSRSLTVNIVKQNFQCFSCKARGNVLDFVAKKEGCTIKEAAHKLAVWFKVGNTVEPHCLTPENKSPDALTILAEIKARVNQLEQLLQQKA